jgi:hypothetical protein
MLLTWNMLKLKAEALNHTVSHTLVLASTQPLLQAKPAAEVRSMQFWKGFRRDEYRWNRHDWHVDGDGDFHSFLDVAAEIARRLLQGPHKSWQDLLPGTLEQVTGSTSEAFLPDYWVYVLHALTWEEPRPVPYECEVQWFNGESFDSSEFSVASHLPDLARATVEVVAVLADLESTTPRAVDRGKHPTAVHTDRLADGGQTAKEPMPISATGPESKETQPTGSSAALVSAGHAAGCTLDDAQGKKWNEQTPPVGTTGPVKPESAGGGRGPYFLTVRLPYLLLGTDAADDPDRAAEPNLTHEKKSHAFYEVDSQTMAIALLETFKQGKPVPGISGDPAGGRGSPDGIQKLAEGVCHPIFGRISIADLSLADRVLCRQQLKGLALIAKERSWEAGAWSAYGLPDDRVASILSGFYTRAQEWEPLVRDELDVMHRKGKGIYLWWTWGEAYPEEPTADLDERFYFYKVASVDVAARIRGAFSRDHGDDISFGYTAGEALNIDEAVRANDCIAEYRRRECQGEDKDFFWQARQWESHLPVRQQPKPLTREAVDHGERSAMLPGQSGNGGAPSATMPKKDEPFPGFDAVRFGDTFAPPEPEAYRRLSAADLRHLAELWNSAHLEILEGVEKNSAEAVGHLTTTMYFTQLSRLIRAALEERSISSEGLYGAVGALSLFATGAANKESVYKLLAEADAAVERLRTRLVSEAQAAKPAPGPKPTDHVLRPEIIHFEIVHEAYSDAKGAAQWAWQCVKDLAAYFCKNLCSACRPYDLAFKEHLTCEEESGVGDWLMTGERDCILADWAEKQRNLHEALRYLPELRKIADCPACAIARAFVCFPEIAKYSPSPPVAEVVIYQGMDFFDGWAPNTMEDNVPESFPCCKFSNCVEGDDVGGWERMREEVLLQLEIEQLPPMPPPVRAALAKTFVPGQQIAKRLNAMAEGWKEEPTETENVGPVPGGADAGDAELAQEASVEAEGALEAADGVGPGKERQADAEEATRPFKPKSVYLWYTWGTVIPLNLDDDENEKFYFYKVDSENLADRLRDMFQKSQGDKLWFGYTMGEALGLGDTILADDSIVKYQKNTNSGIDAGFDTMARQWEQRLRAELGLDGHDHEKGVAAEPPERTDEEVRDLIQGMLPTAVVSVMAMRELIQLAHLYPESVDQQEFASLRKQLTSTLEAILQQPGFERFLAFHQRPDALTPGSDEHLAMLFSILLMWHPAARVTGSPEEIEAGVHAASIECQKAALEPCQTIQNRLGEIMIYDCRIPHPKGDSRYQDKRRFLALLDYYWRLCRGPILDQTDASIGFQPHPLLPLIVNAKARIDACFGRLASLGKAQEVWDTVSKLLDALLAGDPEEFSVVPEFARGEVAKVDAFLAESRLLLGSTAFEPTQAEQAFAMIFKRDAAEYQRKVKERWSSIMEEANAEALRLRHEGLPTGGAASPPVVPADASLEPASLESDDMLAGKADLDADMIQLPQVAVDLVQKDDGWHWIVDSRDTGRLATSEDRIIYKISRILFDQIGHGWVHHRTFYQTLGWNKSEYFDQDRMQKQLTILRRCLGIKVEFQKSNGVRLPSNVVKTKSDSK